MLTPSIFSSDLANNIFSEMFLFPFDNLSQKIDRLMSNNKLQMTQGIISTDIREYENSYRLDFELPGFRKEDIKADITDGYLTIHASRSSEESKKDEAGNYIRRECCTGECKRSFYVGENITPDEVHASFENGLLKLEIPKKQETAEQNDRKYISIADE